MTENASFQNESFQNAPQRGDARGQKKTQVFDLSDVRSRSIGSWMMSYIIYYACSVRNAIEIPPFNCFPVYGRKRSTCFLWTRVFFFFFKTGGIFGYVWTGPESLSKPMLLLKNAQIKQPRPQENFGTNCTSCTCNYSTSCIINTSAYITTVS